MTNAMPEPMATARLTRTCPVCGADYGCEVFFGPDSWPAPIPVEERLPEDGERVLWWVHGGIKPRWCNGKFRAAFDAGPGDPFGASCSDCVELEDKYIQGQNCSLICDINTFTHWLPLPPPIT